MEQDTSAEYNEFLDFLGDRVKLQGFTGYSGGLDTISMFFVYMYVF